MNYASLSTPLFRKKLRELGIPDSGPRHLLQRRHTEWMNLWNANCDSRTPKSKTQLLHELGTWERTQGGNIPLLSGYGGGVGNTAVLRKDFNTTTWSATHSDSYRDLIASARKNMKKPAPKENEDERQIQQETARNEVTETDLSGATMNYPGQQQEKAIPVQMTAFGGESTAYTGPIPQDGIREQMIYTSVTDGSTTNLEPITHNAIQREMAPESIFYEDMACCRPGNQESIQGRSMQLKKAENIANSGPMPTSYNDSMVKTDTNEMDSSICEVGNDEAQATENAKIIENTIA